MSSPRLLFALLSLALLAASCTSSPSETTGAPSPTAEDTAGNETEGASIDATGIIAAIEQLGTTPHRAESFIDFPTDTPDADRLDSAQPVMSYEFDGTWSSATMLLGPNQAQGEPMGFTITDRSTAYFYVPGFDRPEATNLYATNVLAAAFDSWVVVDVDALNAAIPQGTPLTIAQSAQDEIDQIVQALRAVPTAVEGPTSSSRGVPTKTYEMVIEADPDDLFPSTTTVTIHLDDQGRVREIALADSPSPARGGRTEFFDFDADIVIELPLDASDETAAWLASLIPASTPVPTFAPLPTPTPERPVSGPTVLDLLDAQPELSTFRALIAEAPGVEAMLELPNPEPWTIFAPTNDALEANGEALQALRDQPLVLRTFVQLHIAPGNHALDALARSGSVVTFDRWTLDIASSNGRFTVSRAAQTADVLIGDIPAADGMLHIITRPVDQLTSE